jgi:hypothetical protein
VIGKHLQSAREENATLSIQKTSHYLYSFSHHLSRTFQHPYSFSQDYPDIKCTPKKDWFINLNLFLFIFSFPSLVLGSVVGVFADRIGSHGLVLSLFAILGSYPSSIVGVVWTQKSRTDR